MAWEDLKGPLALGAALAVPAKLYIPKGQRLAEGSLPLVSDDIRRPSLSFSLCRKAFTSSYLHRNPITSPPSPLSAPSLHQYDVPESPFPH